MLTAIRNYIEARRMNKARRVFAFVENRFEDMLAAHLDNAVDQEALAIFALNEARVKVEDQVTQSLGHDQVRDIAYETVSEAITDMMSIEDEVRDEIETQVNDHYFDLDEMARVAVDDRMGYEFSVDDAAREAVDAYVESNRYEIREHLDEAINSAVDHLVRESDTDLDMVNHRLSEVEIRFEGLAERVHTDSEIRELARDELRMFLNSMLQVLDGEEQFREVSE